MTEPTELPDAEPGDEAQTATPRGILLDPATLVDERNGVTLDAQTHHQFQQIISRFLDAELDHSVRQYRDANRKLDGIRHALTVLAEQGHPLLSGVERVTSKATQLNIDLLERRHAVAAEYRRPKPPAAVLAADEVKRLLGLYAAAFWALGPDLGREDENLGVIRRSMMLDPDENEPEPSHAQRLRERFVHRDRIAAQELGFDRDPTASAVEAGDFALADLQHDRGWVAVDVLLVIKQAHLDIQEVEHARSQAVQGMLGRSRSDIARERQLLRRSIVLSTLSLVVSQVLPWAFAADENERKALQADLGHARDRTDPSDATWVARQVAMLSLYRRAHGFRLLGDHARSYNDYRKLQRISRLTRPRTGGGPESINARTTYVDILSALGEYRIGDLYRSDHDYSQALEHLCTGHENLLHAGRSDVESDMQALEVRFPRLEVHLRLCKGTAYFETGEIKRALKWHVHAWSSLEDLVDRENQRDNPRERDETERADVEGLARYLEGVRHDPELDKTTLRTYLAPAVAMMCARRVPMSLKALAADVLARIGHILLVLNFARDDHSVPLSLTRAVELDPYNLFARTTLLRWRLMEALEYEADGAPPDLIDPATLPDPVSCWPSGASDVDQAIRLGTHLLLRRLLEDARNGHPDIVGGGPYDVDTWVARELVAGFIDQTDSIYLRLEVINHYLMRPRVEAQRPELDEQFSTAPHLEFVSLGRYGGFRTSPQRPAAVSAVGGGYLVRICPPPTDPDRRQSVFNVLVDPGHGLVENLYREGFGIADIDMVIITNDHPGHLAALDVILSLRDGRRPLERAEQKGAATKAEHRLVLLGNATVRRRYKGHEHILVRDLGNQYLHPTLPPGVSIRALRSIDKDANHDSMSFVLTFDPPGSPLMAITFLSDIGTVALGSYVDGRVATIDADAATDWKQALANDIVVANVGEVSVGELRDLALPEGEETDGGHAASEFHRCLNALDDSDRTDEAVRIRRALSLPPGHGERREPSGLREPSRWADIADPEHRNLRGLLAVAKQMSEPTSPGAEPRPRILLVSELREQLVAFRRTIADEINKNLFAVGTPTVSMTADVGLRIQLDSGHRNQVLCSVCSLNNDRLTSECYYDPRTMTEVCVKGDGEATYYWTCLMHTSERSALIEHRGGYRPLASADRFED